MHSACENKTCQAVQLALCFCLVFRGHLKKTYEKLSVDIKIDRSKRFFYEDFRTQWSRLIETLLSLALHIHQQMNYDFIFTAQDNLLVFPSNSSAD